MSGFKDYGLGFKDITPTMEKEVKKILDNEMDITIIQGLSRKYLPIILNPLLALN